MTRIFLIVLAGAVAALGFALITLPFLQDFDMYVGVTNIGFTLFGASILCLPWVLTPCSH